MTDIERKPLRLVPPLVPVSIVPVAGHVGAYGVRRGGPVEAIVHQGAKGDWYIMYGWVPGNGDIGEWMGSATVSRFLTDVQAGDAAAELVDAYALGVKDWPELLGRLIDVGGMVADLGRLHAPDQYGYCTGDNARTEDDRTSWRECVTVRILAGSVGLDIGP
jgi:hypothetical protein